MPERMERYQRIASYAGVATFVTLAAILVAGIATFARARAGCTDECDPKGQVEKNRIVEVDFQFLKYSEGQVQPTYDVRTRVCCDLCLKKTCYVWWSMWAWQYHCTDWKRKFAVLMSEETNWQNLDTPNRSYKSRQEVEAHAKEMSNNDACVKVK
jgi:hypothetical protein